MLNGIDGWHTLMTFYYCWLTSIHLHHRLQISLLFHCAICTQQTSCHTKVYQVHLYNVVCCELIRLLKLQSLWPATQNLGAWVFHHGVKLAWELLWSPSIYKTLERSVSIKEAFFLPCFTNNITNVTFECKFLQFLKIAQGLKLIFEDHLLQLAAAFPIFTCCIATQNLPFPDIDSCADRWMLQEATFCVCKSGKCLNNSCRCHVTGNLLEDLHILHQYRLTMFYESYPFP